MNCSCVICWVRLQSNHNIIATDCGHIFHNKCLNDWIERSQTCPECRKDINSTKIRRLYLNFTNDDTIQDDPAVLQEQIDKLQYLTRLHESQILKLTAQKKSYEQRISGLDQDLSKQTNEVRKLDAVIFALEEQLKGHKVACEESRYYKEQTTKIKVELESLKGYLIHEKTAHEHYKSLVQKLELHVSQYTAKVEKLEHQLAEAENKYLNKAHEVDTLRGILTEVRLRPLETPTSSTINNDSILMSTMPDTDDNMREERPVSRGNDSSCMPYNLVIKSIENKENEPHVQNGSMFSYFKRKLSPLNLSLPEYGYSSKRLMGPNYLTLEPYVPDVEEYNNRSDSVPTTSGQQKKNFVSITDTHLSPTNNLSASSALSLSSSSLSSQSSSSSTCSSSSSSLSASSKKKKEKRNNNNDNNIKKKNNNNTNNNSNSNSNNNNINLQPTELVDLTGDNSIIIDLT
ncbi:myb-like protein I [Microplitis mediator]|uniref:myb-like protein I n=1 Tax=Microplitis mediator TaxID=375433 RepID=UPI002554AB8C|nr:myb-like protein I [Microplitis mediator]